MERGGWREGVQLPQSPPPTAATDNNDNNTYIFQAVSL